MKYAIHRLGDIVEGHQNDIDYYTPISTETKQYFEHLYSDYDQELTRLANLYRGQQCHIVGCGPSVDRYSGCNWSDKTVIGVNRAYSKVPKLDYWFCIDNFINRSKDSDILAWYKTPSNYYKVIRRGIVVDDLTPPPDLMVRFAEYPSDKLIHGVNWENSAVQGAIDFARHLGFSEIYLWGVDYTPEYASKRNFSRVVDRFQQLYEVCKARSVKVFNCNPESNLTVFPFVNPERFFSGVPVASVVLAASTPSEKPGEPEAFVERTEVHADHIDFYYGNELLVLGMDDLFKYKNGKALVKAAKLLSSVPQRLDE